MAEIAEMVRLAEAALGRGETLCLATVVRVEGSSYRKPGARMLLTSGGARAGTISGGCLEAEVAKKAWWLSAAGPVIERYSSFFDDEEPMPYGLGCGGTVWVLLEQGEAARAVVAALSRVRSERRPALVVTAAEGRSGTRLVRMVAGERLYSAGGAITEQVMAGVLERRSSELVTGGDGDLFVEFVAPPPGLFVFGAGDDAQPLAAFADALGWQVTVADGRSHLARRERFPQAMTRVIDYKAGVLVEGKDNLDPGPDDLAVLLTHSYEQDRAILAALLPRPLAYLGVLGPRRRTERLVRDLQSSKQDRAPGPLAATAAQSMARIRTPVGLDLGGDDPAAIALSIVAELQAVLHRRTVSVARRPLPKEQMAGRLDAVGD